MSNDEAKALITKMVVDHQGLKSPELAAKIIERTKGRDKKVDWITLIGECVSEGKILEIEYIIPGLHYRTKSFLLPKGAEIIKNGNRR